MIIIESFNEKCTTSVSRYSMENDQVEGEAQNDLGSKVEKFMSTNRR